MPSAGPIQPSSRSTVRRFVSRSWAARVGSPALPGSSCGALAGKKEILINPSPPQRFARQRSEPYSGAPVTFPIDLPLDPGLVDVTVHGQAFFVQTNGRGRLTNAVAMTIGQPNG